jgi:DnaJ-class molecular chaperone
MIDFGDCWKCGGTGRLTVSLGKYSSTIECNICDGSGMKPEIDNNE